MKKNEENSLSSYMEKASSHPLLSRGEETELAETVRKWLDSPRAGKVMRRKGMEARKKLIESNLRLVIKIAKEYRNLGLDFSDLISEGNIGLMLGVEKFRPDKGAKFSYYASFWIKQSIRRSISNKGRTIRLPVAVVDLKIKVTKFIDNFKNKYVRAPSNEEVAQELNIPLSKVKSLLDLDFQSRSLNEKISEERGENELLNVVENINAANPYEVFLDKDDEHLLNNFINDLDIRQQYIIKHRFGLGTVEPKTLEVIGKKFNLTRERIRQLEAIALEKLREMYQKINCTSYKK